MPADNNDAMAFIDKNAGPAFPADYAMPEGGTLSFPGMMLRDWFAGQALAGIIAGATDELGTRASAAYAYADAMIAERNKRA